MTQFLGLPKVRVCCIITVVGQLPGNVPGNSHATLILTSHSPESQQRASALQFALRRVSPLIKVLSTDSAAYLKWKTIGAKRQFLRYLQKYEVANVHPSGRGCHD
jgi:hypothetical protein